MIKNLPYINSYQFLYALGNVQDVLPYERHKITHNAYIYIS